MVNDIINRGRDRVVVRNGGSEHPPMVSSRSGERDGVGGRQGGKDAPLRNIDESKTVLCSFEGIGRSSERRAG